MEWSACDCGMECARLCACYMYVFGGVCSSMRQNEIER